jgi:hypothetical protein
MTTRNLSALALAAAVMAFATTAEANGGPLVDQERHGGAIGGLAPMQRDDIELLEARIAIRLDPLFTISRDGAKPYFYEVVADYRLRNDGAPREVAFGVPLRWAAEDDSTPSEPLVIDDTARAAERSVSLQLGGRSYPCHIAKVWRGVAHAHGFGTGRAWCVTRIPLPSGESTLQFGHMGEFVPPSLRRPPWPGGEWTLAYDVFPADTWKGRPGLLHVELDLRGLPGHVTVRRPAGATLRGGSKNTIPIVSHVLVWDLREPDPKTTRDLVVVWYERLGAVQAADSYRDVYREVATRVDLRASASSELAPQGGRLYGAGQAVDGDLRTAWCKGRPGDGTGEWLEVSGASALDAAWCHLVGFELVPGYARSQETYRSNGRGEAFRLLGCDKKLLPWVDLDLGRQGADGRPLLADRVENARLTLERPQELPGDTRCLRLSVTRVAPGREPDVCVSEFRPVFACEEPLTGPAAP